MISLLKKIKDSLGLLKLHSSTFGYSGCQWMRGRFYPDMNKGVELSLWDNGEFYFQIYEEYYVSLEAQPLLGEKDERTIIDLTIPTPFKRRSDRQWH